jgi:Holin of 3TMs, for gene-transfer release
MVDTVLAKKSGPQDNAIAKNDDHHDLLSNDPTISAFPQGAPFGGFNNATTNISSSGPSVFGQPSTGGFGSTSCTGSTGFGTSAYGSTSSFGTPASTTTGGFGASGGFGAASLGTSSFGQGPAQVIQNQGGALSEGGESTVKLDKDANDWVNRKWRPVMGWVYMLTCTCDFVLFPILWSLLQALNHGQVTSQWQPLTLQGAGLYHIAMGAVLGIAAYGRTKEKVAGAA